MLHFVINAAVRSRTDDVETELAQTGWCWARSRATLAAMRAGDESRSADVVITSGAPRSTLLRWSRSERAIFQRSTIVWAMLLSCACSSDTSPSDADAATGADGGAETSAAGGASGATVGGGASGAAGASGGSGGASGAGAGAGSGGTTGGRGGAIDAGGAAGSSRDAETDASGGHRDGATDGGDVSNDAGSSLDRGADTSADGASDNYDASIDASAPPSDASACIPLPTAGVYATFRVVSDVFRASITNPTGIDQALALWRGQSQAKIPTGQLECNSGTYNCGWTWSMTPASITFAEITIEVCDATPSYVQGNCASFPNGRYCPWSAELIELRDCRTQADCPVVSR